MGRICVSVFDWPGVKQLMDYVRMKFFPLFKVPFPLSKTICVELVMRGEGGSWRLHVPT